MTFSEYLHDRIALHGLQPRPLAPTLPAVFRLSACQGPWSATYQDRCAWQTASGLRYESSWLGRHHIQLQWGLLIAGLSIRILIANSNGVVLAVMSGAALLGALVTGWAYAGKSWCQYICPFGVAQQVITGPRSLPGRDAHLNPTSRTTQSMCRTQAGDAGQADVSACVACIKPCMDIDSERHYWSNLQKKRGLNWAWYSYPGLVIGFFLLVESYAPNDTTFQYLDYLESHLYTYDNRSSMA